MVCVKEDTGPRTHFDLKEDASEESEEGRADDKKGVILHFDINKTLIIADSIMNKSVEYTIREVVANQFWGWKVPNTSARDSTLAVQHESSKDLAHMWKWNKMEPSLVAPANCDDANENGDQVTYLNFCREVCMDKSAARLSIRSFELVSDPCCKQMMVDTAERAVKAMVIPKGLRTDELTEQTGLVGDWQLVFPSFFKFAAQLQRDGCRFAVTFRSFGMDLTRVRTEWNAFCENRHPIYRECLKDVGPMDGSQQGVPDRRINEEDVHTMFRDADGPVLALSVMTNGNWEGEWDDWGRSKVTEDTRGARDFFVQQGIETVDGYANLQAWFKQQLKTSKSNMIRDDFAWWHKNGEASSAGKVMIGLKSARQIFFDDNIGVDECRIIDPRTADDFQPVPADICLGASCVRADPLQAMLHESYFLDAYTRAISRADAETNKLWILPKRRKTDKNRSSTYSDTTFSRQTMLSRGTRTTLSLCSESRTVSSPNQEQSNDYLGGPDVDSLTGLLDSAGVNLELFGAPGTTYKSVEDLHAEIKAGKSKLMMNSGKIRRHMEVVRVKLMCGNLILCETHEQLADGRLRSRNGYLPACKKKAVESVADALDRWASEELHLKIKEEERSKALQSCLHKDEVTNETMSYPLECATRYYELCCNLNPQHLEPVVLDRLGLPAGTIFSTSRGQKKTGKATSSTKYWAWYRTEVWEAMTAKKRENLPDINANLEALFKNHPLRTAYKSLLLQMFDSFSAWKLCGGMSGSLVLQVQPVDPINGRNEESVIVKLDKADVVSREIANSKRVWNALSDRAARILGQGCFFTDENKMEYGAFKIELAGGCWQVPELAQGNTKDLLYTFKDLLAVESQRQLLHTNMHHLFSVCGDVEMVLLELLGPGGMLRVLRREALTRSPKHIFGSFNYSGKDTRWNPFFVADHFQRAPMEELWRRTFGAKNPTQEMPEIREQVRALMDCFAMAEQGELGKYRPLVGLAHGDLNAMNVLIDVMNAVWLIDFAFSEEKPLCWDLAKLEGAFMFEYAVVPVCWRTLLQFAGAGEDTWRERKVSAWLGVGETMAMTLLRKLTAMQELGNARQQSVDLPRRHSSDTRIGAAQTTAMEEPLHSTVRDGCRTPERRSGSSDRLLEQQLSLAIKAACDEVYQQPLDQATSKKRDADLCRLGALLVATYAEEEAALGCCATITEAMLAGDTLQAVMEPSPVQSHCAEGASVAFCWAKAMRLRLFLKDEWLQHQHDVSEGLLQADESPLLFWLALLQEVYRCLGYLDVSPWVKCWIVHYLQKLLSNIEAWIATHASTAMQVLQVSQECKRVSNQMVLVAPRAFPTEMHLQQRVLAQRGGTPSSLASRRRLRLVHAKTQSLACLSGLFAEIRAVSSMTWGNRTVRAELVRSSMSDSEAAKLCKDQIFLKCNEHCVAVITTSGNRESNAMTVQMLLPLLPLGPQYVSSRQRRQGIRAEGYTPEGDIITAVFSVMDTAFCYAPGSRLRLTPNNVAPLRPGMRLRHATVEALNERDGNYRVIWDNTEKKVREDAEVDPFEGNHLHDSWIVYPEGTRLMVMAAGANNFEDAVVTQAPVRNTTKHLTTLRFAKGKPLIRQVDVNEFNHSVCHEKVDVAAMEDEVMKYRIFAKMKNSFIWTVTSERADVLEGPVPRLSDDAGREAFFWSEVQSFIATDTERWSVHYYYQGIIVLGQPGSGKSCMLLKIVMQCLSQSMQSTILLPLLIPVINLCTRLQKFLDEGGHLQNDVEGLIEWYLRAVFGGDTNRYFMLNQALQSHRLLLLFDGIDEAGPLIPYIERCITGLVAHDHRVIATARLPEGTTTTDGSRRASSACSSTSIPWLKTAPELFRVLELLPLEAECRRSLVEALLNRDENMSGEEVNQAGEFVEDFVMELDEDEWRKWSTPMMVSILVASWREKHRQEHNDGCNSKRDLKESLIPEAAPEELSRANVSEVYRVTLDLLLRRFQSRKQADRHKIKSRVQKFKALLALLAFNLSIKQMKDFTESDVLPLLEQKGMEISVWGDICEAIQEGRMPLLHTCTNEGSGEVRFMFSYTSFQQYLSSVVYDQYVGKDNFVATSNEPCAPPLSDLWCLLPLQMCFSGTRNGGAHLKQKPRAS